jgi:hypothetical protein
MTKIAMKIVFWVGLALALRAWYMSEHPQRLIDACAKADMHACGIIEDLKYECAAGHYSSCHGEYQTYRGR